MARLEGETFVTHVAPLVREASAILERFSIVVLPRAYDDCSLTLAASLRVIPSTARLLSLRSSRSSGFQSVCQSGTSGEMHQSDVNSGPSPSVIEACNLYSASLSQTLPVSHSLLVLENLLRSLLRRALIARLQPLRDGYTPCRSLVSAVWAEEPQGYTM